MFFDLTQQNRRNCFLSFFCAGNSLIAGTLIDLLTCLDCMKKNFYVVVVATLLLVGAIVAILIILSRKSQVVPVTTTTVSPSTTAGKIIFSTFGI